MTYRKNPWQSYQQVAAQTASPGQLIQMLYDGAVRFLNQAIDGFRLEDPAGMNECVHNNLQRAQAIIDELNNSLDLSSGGELADRLRGLYNYMDRRLDESNRSKSREGIEEVLRLITGLRDAWTEMLSQDGAPPSASSSRAAA